jgi:hypothetical protein
MYLFRFDNSISPSTLLTELTSVNVLSSNSLALVDKEDDRVEEVDADSDDELLGLVPKAESSHESSNKTILQRTLEPASQKRYIRHPWSYKIMGYVVQVHDATNFDIDLDLTSDLISRYSNVISNEYKYKYTTDQGWYSHPEDIMLAESTGKAYRCRLRGIGINPSLPYAAHSRKSQEIKEDVRRLFDRSDGWCTCTLSDVDIYSRLLVDITLYISGALVNLKEYILNLMTDPKWKDLPIYCPYIK